MILRILIIFLRRFCKTSLRLGAYACAMQEMLQGMGQLTCSVGICNAQADSRCVFKMRRLVMPAIMVAFFTLL